MCLYFFYNCIDNNNQCVGNWIYVHNTDPSSYYRYPKIRVVVRIVLL